MTVVVAVVVCVVESHVRNPVGQVCAASSVNPVQTPPDPLQWPTVPPEHPVHSSISAVSSQLRNPPRHVLSNKRKRGNEYAITNTHLCGFKRNQNKNIIKYHAHKHANRRRPCELCKARKRIHYVKLALIPCSWIHICFAAPSDVTNAWTCVAPMHEYEL